VRPQSVDQQAFTWQATVGLIAGAQDYWVCTVRPDLRPHATPVWGVWWRDRVVFSTPAGTVKARNLAARPAAVVHLASGADTVVIDGTATPVVDTADLVELSAAFTDKYGGLTGFTYDLAAARAAGMAVLAVRVWTVRAWRAGMAFQATRWTLDDAGDAHVAATVTAADFADGAPS
jgi:hypothetical protein